jgi:ATP-binding cassette subfamily B protein
MKSLKEKVRLASCTLRKWLKTKEVDCMRKTKKVWRVEKPDRILSYFKMDIIPLTIVTVSGIIYNIGMTAGPYFEGQLAQRLFDIIKGKRTAYDMLSLAAIYLLIILGVQGARCIKRFYVRRFANDTSRGMRRMLYNSLVHKSKSELEQESIGTIMTKAVSDVDACTEGMRKFTTEVFDTGVVLAAYMVMLFFYDWRLALISCSFTPAAYIIAEKLKKVVYRYNSAYKKSAGKLNDATMDRVSNAITYRVYGREQDRNEAYEERLEDYEKRAVWANIWGTTMQPVYNIISMTGAVFIIYLGSRNVLGTGWTNWNIAAFTTFLSCFGKMALKTSKAAKLFNAVQKAQVSWRRIRPLMKDYVTLKDETSIDFSKPMKLKVSRLSFTYPGGQEIIKDISFMAEPGEIIGITGSIASGKSTLGKAFLCESPYDGSITIGDYELTALTEYEHSRMVSYMGHDPELMDGSIEDNICLGREEGADKLLKAVLLDKEVRDMPYGIDTCIGSSGVRLSGGQQARVALARTLMNAGKVLILDDPLSAVDKVTEGEIMENIRSMCGDKIVILISHRLWQFPKLDKVVWLERGRAQAGTHASLMESNTRYARLYEAQAAGGDLDEA